MTLKEVIQRLEHFDRDQTIYVTNYTPDAEAIVESETSDGRNPHAATGMRYLLEIDLARDAIRVWSEWRVGREPTVDQKIDAVVYYAQHDTFVPTDESDSES